MAFLDHISRYRHPYKNWIKVMYSMKKGTTPIILKIGNEISIEHDSTAYLTHFLSSGTINVKDVKDLLSSGILKFRYKDRELKMKVNKPRGDEEWQFNGDIVNVFYNEDYKFLATKDTKVVDICGNIGDTAIYFALNRAGKIVAIEPYSYSFEMAKHNIEINNFQETIQLFNAGYRPNVEMVVGKNQVIADSNLNQTTKEGIKIPIMSLKPILAKSGFEIHAPIYPKMDCEGYEYNLLQEDRETLSRFERIHVEYHDGIKVLDKLFMELGYQVDFTNPVETYNIRSSNSKMSMGFLHAKKRKNVGGDKYLACPPRS